VDPRFNVIKYIGKGSANRMFIHIKSLTWKKPLDKNYTKTANLKEILNDGYEDIAYCKLYESDNEQECFEKEIEFIKLYKTHISENGWNLTRGGENPPNAKGLKRSLKTKELMSEKQRHRSIETRKRISESKLGEKHPLFGKRPWNYGQKTSNEIKQKLSKARKKWWAEKKAELE